MSTPLAETALRAVLSRMKCGHLTLVDTAGVSHEFAGSEQGPSATVVLRSPEAAGRVLSARAIGLAEGYMEGDWDTPDLDAVLALGIANMPPARRSALTFTTPMTKLWHRLRDNSPTGSKKNIGYHYDLGNDFYRLWLDETMTYSSAMFEGRERDLPEAQRAKWDHLLDRLQPSSKDHVLEIGCGWGGFALHAAREAGCKVTGLTLSEEQHAWATRSVQEAGLEHLIDIRLQDYRATPETFSAIASIEMFEAVGERWWPVFFGRMKELLRSGGAAAMQVITIDDRRFDDYRRNPDFTQRYIFPGGMLPSPERFAKAAGGSGLRTGAPQFFGGCYAETLRRWAEKFEEHLPEVRALGFDERFIRMWRYYYSYCIAGFSAGSVDVMQVRLDT